MKNFLRFYGVILCGTAGWICWDTPVLALVLFTAGFAYSALVDDAEKKS